MAEGFIRQRGTAWQVIVHAGRDPLTGKRRNLTGTARTKREAQALRARLLTQVNEGKRLVATLMSAAIGRLDGSPAADSLPATSTDTLWSLRSPRGHGNERDVQRPEPLLTGHGRGQAG
jgi:hypothetical protein